MIPTTTKNKLKIESSTEKKGTGTEQLTDRNFWMKIAMALPDASVWTQLVPNCGNWEIPVTAQEISRG